MNLSTFGTIRKYLHQNPELSGSELATGVYIEEKVKSIWPNVRVERIDQNLIFTPRSDFSTSKHIAFRCELDALPIQETNDFEHASKVQGVSHKCGHDGHMVILLRLAYLLKIKPLNDVTISLIYQSAEENGIGADQLVKKAKLFLENKPDYVFSLHNVPGYEKSAVVFKKGIFTPTVVSFKTLFFGKTSHAAEPEKGINPAFSIAEILLEIREKVENDNMFDSLTVAPIEMGLGKPAYGISAGKGMIGFTIRSEKPEDVMSFTFWYEEFVAEKCKSANLKFETFWFEAFNSIINDESATDTIEESAQRCQLQLIQKGTPFNWGEDFGLYTEFTKGAMFGLGAGINHAVLHSPEYDFPDELIETGSDLFYEIAQSYNK